MLSKYKEINYEFGIGTINFKALLNNKNDQEEIIIAKLDTCINRIKYIDKDAKDDIYSQEILKTMKTRLKSR